MIRFPVLPPLQLMEQWRREGLSPREVRQRADEWLAQHYPVGSLPLVLRTRFAHRGKPGPKANGKPPVQDAVLLPVPEADVSEAIHPKPKPGRPRKPETDPLSLTRPCLRCGVAKVLRDGYLKPRDLVCKECEQVPSEAKERAIHSRQFKAIGAEVLYQECLALGVEATAAKYHISRDTLRKYLPGLPRWQAGPGKLPPDPELRELAQRHTMTELAKMYGCTRERVRQRCVAIGIKTITPIEAKVKRAGGEAAVRAIVWARGIHAANRETGLGEGTLKRMFPDAPNHQGKHSDPRRKLPRKAELARLYDRHEASFIAKKYGATVGTVRMALHRHGITKRGRWTPERVRTEVLRFAWELGHPEEMPRIREFHARGETKLLWQVGILGGLQAVARSLGLAYHGPGRIKKIEGLPPVGEIVAMAETLGVKETAQRLGVSPGLVYSRVGRARRKASKMDGAG